MSQNNAQRARTGSPVLWGTGTTRYAGGFREAVRHVREIHNVSQIVPVNAAAKAPVLLRDLLAALLPGAELAICWRDTRLGTGSVATPVASDALRARATELLGGMARGALPDSFDFAWEEAGARVAVAAAPAGVPTADERRRWHRLATATVALFTRFELARNRIQSLRKSERLQQALYEIADLSGSSLEMPDMLARLHTVVASLMLAENFYIVLYDDERETVRFLYFADQNDPWQPDPDNEIAMTALPNSLTVALLRYGRPLMGPSESIRERLGVGRDTGLGPDSADWLGVPVRRDTRVGGAIVVQSYDRPNTYTHEDRALLEYVAQHILTALDRKHAQGELERRVGERTQELRHANEVLQAEIVERQRAERLQRALYRISEMSVGAGSLERFYADVHEVVSGLVYAENFYIAMLAGDGERIDFPYSVDERDPVRSTRRMINGLTEFVIASGEPLLADRATIDGLEASGSVISQGSRAYCWLGVPLVGDESVLGVIAVQSYSPEVVFDGRDQALLTFVSHHISIALSRKRAQESLRAAHVELESRVEARTRELRDANRELRALIGERSRAEQRLIHQARHDQLTGLPNREHLLEKLDATIAGVRAGDSAPFAVLFFDLDRFKLVNDSVGHAAGDDLLVEAGRRVRRALAAGDTVARLGGDEFAVLLQDVPDPAIAQRVASRLLAELGKPMWIAGRELFPSASIGIAYWEARYRHGEDMLRDADAAMYRAKARGRDRSELFDEAMRAEAMRLLDLEADLRRAILADDFEPFFQPVVRLEDGETVGHEALLRWHHEQRGLLVPSDFIGVGEDSGLIAQVDWLMYAHVVRWLGRQPGEGYVSINVSPRHFISDDFAERLLRLIDDAGADPARLRIEITEGALLDDAPRALRTLNALRERGVGAMLDDFGTGYSALSYLHRFPIQSLKIDQSFVAGLSGASHAESLALVRAILALAGTLGIETVGEGIETSAQRDLLLQLGCGFGQGYYYGRPRSGD